MIVQSINFQLPKNSEKSGKEKFKNHRCGHVGNGTATMNEAFTLLFNYKFEFKVLHQFGEFAPNSPNANSVRICTYIPTCRLTLLFSSCL